MRARMAAAAGAAVASLVLVAGCGSAGGVRVGAPDPSTAGAQPDCGDVVVDLDATGAREVCLNVGSTVRVRIGAKDVPANLNGTALTEVSPGVYRGARAGSAQLSGFRHACPGAKPGGVSCHAIVGWKVTVSVR
ncbi:hypothetical protein SAMN05216267_10142 [Actinacidiphila rubida]|uniref:Lipoprotein n=2 Tax=Actinacidiphila rubida TaxID=310780 RepID=A0A1H8KT47_9ACTN|nr:hypothetical protein [Actinacidiphila rubida]SEN96082.1 hypothetical protein SAMN05216267_10142 [Actinacidiphila rubida]